MYRYMRRPAEQFYLTVEDPYERKNLAQQHPEIVKQLTRRIDDWAAE